jgi:hypothetical protein
MRAVVLMLTTRRAFVLVVVAALAPIVFVTLNRSTLYDGIRHLLFTIPMLALLAAWALLRMLPLLGRIRIVAAAAGGAYVVALVGTLVVLHPLEYVATNAFAGGTQWSHGRFDLDYWVTAATVALRRLEQRLQQESPSRFEQRKPRILICIPWREHMIAAMFRRDLAVEQDPRKADYIIMTERLDCSDGVAGIVIDEVKRFDRVFARTIETQQGRQNLSFTTLAVR